MALPPAPLEQTVPDTEARRHKNGVTVDKEPLEKRPDTSAASALTSCGTRLHVAREKWREKKGPLAWQSSGPFYGLPNVGTT